jgi:hypothetical protein
MCHPERTVALLQADENQRVIWSLHFAAVRH